jgi:hypothetical protein
VEDVSLIPRDVPITDFGEIVELEVRDGFLHAVAYGDGLIVEIDPEMQRQLGTAGYQIVGHDNEGFEAEIFFARGADTVGTIQMREGPCDDQVTLRLSYGAPRFEKAGS